MTSNRHALVFGASGISGWGIVNALLEDYPTPGTFGKVTGLTNRPLDKAISGWPEDERLSLISGIDLLKGSQEELNEQFRTKVPSIESVTHAFFTAYIFTFDTKKECRVNTDLMVRSVNMLESLCPQFEFFVMQTGAKQYGIHLLGDICPFKPPFNENLPPIPEPYLSQLFYTPQLEALKALGEGKRWKWAETRPDIILGFVPNNSVHNLSQIMALYLSLYAAVEGSGATCPFPGTMKSYKALSIDSFQDIIAHISIYLSLYPEKSAYRAFNTADSAEPTNWEKKWPLICEYFGLIGTPPGDKPVMNVNEYLSKNRPTWDKVAKEKGLREGIIDSDLTNPAIQSFLMTSFDFDRWFGRDRVHSVGFTEEVSVMGAWGTSFDRMRKNKIIP